MENSIQLVEGVRAIIDMAIPIKDGVKIWRVTVKFVSDIPEMNKTIKDYYVWVSGQYLKDKAQLTSDSESAKKFALDMAKIRFDDSGKEVPIENGISCSNKGGVALVNPKEYFFPEENYE